VCVCPRSKVPELVRPSVAAAAGLPVIKRFSGGGTVVVDGDTLLTSLIVQVGGGGGGGGLGGWWVAGVSTLTSLYCAGGWRQRG
jgi:hypothetical protein